MSSDDDSSLLLDEVGVVRIVKMWLQRSNVAVMSFCEQVGQDCQIPTKYRATPLCPVHCYVVQLRCVVPLDF
jgi:hypothetical protein